MQKREQGRLTKIYLQSRLKSPYKKQPFAHRLWTYQRERVPVVALFLVGLILYTAVAWSAHHRFDWTILLATILSTLYLIQVRLADEPKDYEHDLQHHADRPVQRGLVTLGELRKVKYFIIGLFLLLACFSGSLFIIVLAVIQQLYAYAAQREFFVRDWLRQHFLAYQYSHYGQLLVLGWLTTTVLGINGPGEQLLYFGYVVAMSAPIELSRTIGGNDDKNASDRYSHRLGVTIALALFLISVAIVTLYTAFVAQHTGGGNLNPIPLVIGLLPIGYTALRYEHSPTTKNASILAVSAAIIYIASAVTLLVSN